MGNQGSRDSVPRAPFTNDSLTFVGSDVADAGQKMRKGDSAKCTNVSQEVFDPSDGFCVTVSVTQLAGGTVHLGLVPAAGEGYEAHAVGSAGVPGSLSCFIENGNVGLRQGGKTIFRGECNTSDPTSMKMYYVKGELTFAIGRGLVNCVPLKQMRFTGQYRVAVSLSCAGQEAQLQRVGPAHEMPVGASDRGGSDVHKALKALLDSDDDGTGDDSNTSKPKTKNTVPAIAGRLRGRRDRRADRRGVVGVPMGG
jgi:hypothetical protein